MENTELLSLLQQKTLESRKNKTKDHIDFFDKNIVPLLTKSAENGEWYLTFYKQDGQMFEILKNSYDIYCDICSSKGLFLSPQNTDYKMVISWYMK
jgi:hypothetical protein